MVNSYGLERVAGRDDNDEHDSEIARGSAGCRNKATPLSGLVV